MRRKEREQQPAAPAALASSPAPDFNVFDSDKDENDVKVGAEAFVAKGDGSDGYPQPDWETDETLEAYLSA